jgi:hypothetical protein
LDGSGESVLQRFGDSLLREWPVPGQHDQHDARDDYERRSYDKPPASRRPPLSRRVDLPRAAACRNRGILPSHLYNAPMYLGLYGIPHHYQVHRFFNVNDLQVNRPGIRRTLLSVHGVLLSSSPNRREKP